MGAPFDVHDRAAWYFGQLTRQEAVDLLLPERDSGVFLVRDSSSSTGDFVLCVKEDLKVSHYIINRIQLSSDGGGGGTAHEMVYRIGDQSFVDLPELLAFYILHYLDTTPLRRPLARKLERVMGKFDFKANDPDDLPFKKGEILSILNKDEDQWWTARNAQGQTGHIPVPYVQKIDDDYKERPNSGGSGSATSIHNQSTARSPQQQQQHSENTLKRSNLNRKLPAHARVKQARVPNAYDKTALKLEVGDIILVTKTNINGQWEGELKGKTGHFPFTHVEFIESADELEAEGGLQDNDVSRHRQHNQSTDSRY